MEMLFVPYEAQSEFLNMNGNEFSFKGLKKGGAYTLQLTHMGK
jgi:hypothetical protein